MTATAGFMGNAALYQSQTNDFGPIQQIYRTQQELEYESVRPYLGRLAKRDAAAAAIIGGPGTGSSSGDASALSTSGAATAANSLGDPSVKKAAKTPKQRSARRTTRRERKRRAAEKNGAVKNAVIYEEKVAVRSEKKMNSLYGWVMVQKLGAEEIADMNDWERGPAPE